MSRFGAAVSGYKVVDEKSGLRVSYIPRLRRTLKTTPIYSNARKEYTGECPCNICGVKYKAITETHLRHVHSMSMKEYRGLYPSTPLFDDATLAVMTSNAQEEGIRRTKYNVGICIECGKEYPIKKEIHSGKICDNRAKTCSRECLLGRRSRQGLKRKRAYCLKGHEMDEANTILYRSPKFGRTFRKCRICWNGYKKIWRKSKKSRHDRAEYDVCPAQ